SARLDGLDNKGKLAVETSDGKKIAVEADKILVTIGRRPLTEGWGLEEMGLDMAGPFVKIDDQCRTAMRNVWAVGDLTGEPMLAHKAAAQGAMVAEIIAGARRHFDPNLVAAICFTEPEIVTAGLSPDEAVAAGVEPGPPSAPRGGIADAATEGKRTDHPRRRRDADGRDDAAILDPRLPVVGDRRAGQSAGPRQTARRGSRRVPRQRRPDRSDRRILPATPGVPVLRTQRGLQSPVTLSRLEGRRRGQMPGPAQRGPGGPTQAAQPRQ